MNGIYIKKVHNLTIICEYILLTFRGSRAAEAKLFRRPGVAWNKTSR
jgi:hypothetical protein